MSKEKEIITAGTVTKENMFQYFDSIDCSGYLEQKDTSKDGSKKLDYLKFPSVWREVMKVDPMASYRVIEFDENGHRVSENTPLETKVYPFRIEGPSGFTMYTEITILGVAREQALPIINSSNLPIKKETYKMVNQWGKEKYVGSLTSMDINTSKVRCLVKNLALNFGLGLKTYEGQNYDNPDIIMEDVDDVPSVTEKPQPTAVVPPVTKGVPAFPQVEEEPVAIQQGLAFNGVEPFQNISETKAPEIKKEENPFGENPDFNLNEALNVKLEKGKNYKGKTIQAMLDDKLNEAALTKELKAYFQHGNPNEKLAAKVVLAAIENKELQL